MTPPNGDPSTSLLSITIRRSFVNGRTYVIYGAAISALFASLLGVQSQEGFSTGLPVFLPIFAVVGSMGGLIVFTSDRIKGVLEYLLAYGVAPRRLFANVLLASLALVSLVLAVGLGVGGAVHAAAGYSFSTEFVLGIGLYGIPMSFASVAFTTTVGMYWTALSSPREGLNSPVGLAPFFGMIPALVTVMAVVVLGVTTGGVSAGQFYLIAGGAIAAVWATVLVLLGYSGRLLRRERFLSPA